jgi:hypothetical protein
MSLLYGVGDVVVPAHLHADALRGLSVVYYQSSGGAERGAEPVASGQCVGYVVNAVRGHGDGAAVAMIRFAGGVAGRYVHALVRDNAPCTLAVAVGYE